LKTVSDGITFAGLGGLKLISPFSNAKMQMQGGQSPASAFAKNFPNQKRTLNLMFGNDRVTYDDPGKTIVANVTLNPQSYGGGSSDSGAGANLNYLRMRELPQGLTSFLLKTLGDETEV